MSEKCNDAELKVEHACVLCNLVTSHVDINSPAGTKGAVLDCHSAQFCIVLRVKLARHVDVRCDNYYK